MKLFRRKITPEYIRKHYTLSKEHTTFNTYKLGNGLFIENRGDYFCLYRGFPGPSYYICDIEYIYQLKQMLKIYKTL